MASGQFGYIIAALQIDSLTIDEFPWDPLVKFMPFLEILLRKRIFYRVQKPAFHKPAFHRPAFHKPGFQITGFLNTGF